jgi:hypothetical protein
MQQVGQQEGEGIKAPTAANHRESPHDDTNKSKKGEGLHGMFESSTMTQKLINVQKQLKFKAR